MYMQLVLDDSMNQWFIGVAGWLASEKAPNSENMYRFQTTFSVSFLVKLFSAFLILGLLSQVSWLGSA